jgi:hypothetical protein
METKVYRLRPHHVFRLYEALQSGDPREHVRSTINDVSSKEVMVDRISDSYMFGVHHLYCEEFVESVANLFGEIKEDLYSKIEVIDDVDDVCARGCNRFNETCKGSDTDEIKEELMDKLGVKVGDIVRPWQLSEKNTSNEKVF